MTELPYKSALTVDVEDGLNILMKDFFHIDMPPTKRVIDNMNKLLDLFDRKEVKGTFFILGELAEHYPELIKMIASKGHELAVHGYHHDQIFKLNPKKAKADIGRAKDLIEQTGGQEVLGFRAPAFSINKETSWVLDVISELGFKYDSSIMPLKASRYGWPAFSKDVQQLQLENGRKLIEVPMSVVRIFGKSFPACGGGYLRYFPLQMTKRAFQQVQKERAAILYMHPYEVDINKYPDFFYKAKATLPWKKKLFLSLYRWNKATVMNKLNGLLSEFHFVPMREVIKEKESKASIPLTDIMKI